MAPHLGVRSAGSYVCNTLLYLMLHEADRIPAQRSPRCGFIHVPPAGVLGLDSQERGLRAALRQVGAPEMHVAEGALD